MELIDLDNVPPELLAQVRNDRLEAARIEELRRGRGVDYGSRVEISYDPSTGLLTVSGGHDHHGDAVLTIDLVAEFWRITRRETAKEKPPENTYVLVGHDKPMFKMRWQPGWWFGAHAGGYRESFFESWWPLPGVEK